MTVVDGAAVWATHATHGLPLEMGLALIADRGAVPSWDRLLAAAAKDGANIPRLLRRLDEAVADAYAPDVATVIRHRLPSLVSA